MLSREQALLMPPALSPTLNEPCTPAALSWKQPYEQSLVLCPVCPLPRNTVCPYCPQRTHHQVRTHLANSQRNRPHFLMVALTPLYCCCSLSKSDPTAVLLLFLRQQLSAAVLPLVTAPAAGWRLLTCYFSSGAQPLLSHALCLSSSCCADGRMAGSLTSMAETILRASGVAACQAGSDRSSSASSMYARHCRKQTWHTQSTQQPQLQVTTQYCIGAVMRWLC